MFAVLTLAWAVATFGMGSGNLCSLMQSNMDYFQWTIAPSVVYKMYLLFSVDVHAAGEGQLQIMVNNGNIPNEVKAQDVGVYLIQFIPLEPGMQQVDILFNDEALPGGWTFRCY